MTTIVTSMIYRMRRYSWFTLIQNTSIAAVNSRHGKRKLHRNYRDYAY